MEYEAFAIRKSCKIAQKIPFDPKNVPFDEKVLSKVRETGYAPGGASPKKDNRLQRCAPTSLSES
jgi:hypothetical protein